MMDYSVNLEVSLSRLTSGFVKGMLSCLDLPWLSLRNQLETFLG